MPLPLPLPSHCRSLPRYTDQYFVEYSAHRPRHRQRMAEYSVRLAYERIVKRSWDSANAAY